MLSTGIIGAGQAGTSLLNMLLHSDNMRVDFIVDNNAGAPGMMLARDSGVPAFQSIAEALKNRECDIVFEMTGVPAVMEKLVAEIGEGTTKILPSHSWLLIRELEDGEHRTRERVAKDITAIKTQLDVSLDGSRQLVTQINSIMKSMRVLAMNASIEAARAGSQGAGFGVVADHMAKSVDAVRKITEEIDEVNAEILQVTEQINAALARLG